MDGGSDSQPVTAKLRASRRRPPRASRACETCRVRKTKVRPPFASSRLRFTANCLASYQDCSLTPWRFSW